MNRELFDRLKYLANERIDEALQLLKELIEIPTENPPGRNYLEAVNFLDKKLTKMGYKNNIIRVPPETSQKLAPHGEDFPRANIICRLFGDKSEPSIHLNGHFDVIPAGSGWSVDPFKGVIKNGKVYGRGASDMKSGIVAQIFSVEILRESFKELGYKINKPIIQSFTCDEETGGFAGVGYLIDNAYINKENTDYVIITEPTDSKHIIIGHRGVIWFKIKVYGKKAHGANPHYGENSIEKALLILNEIFTKLRPKITSRVSENVLPPDANRATLTPTMINGGLATNVVPDICEIVFDRRLSIDEEASTAVEEVKEFLERHIPFRDYDFELLMSVNPVKVDSNMKLVKTIEDTITEIKNEKPKQYYCSATLDMKFFVNNAGINECIAYGPGVYSTAHTTDEYVPINNIIDSINILSITIGKLLLEGKDHLR
jgi:succinyl-diaminopimelate desuccinylase